MTDVGVQKITSLQRCISRARDARAEAGPNFLTSYNLQDAAILNVVRACDTAIDLANMVIRRRKLGVPNELRDAFATLARENIIPTELAAGLKKMVGFRNLSVHQYRELDLTIVATVIDNNLDDLLTFAKIIAPAL